MSEDAQKFMEKLQELGVVDITRSAKPVDTNSEEMLSTAESLKKTVSQLEEIDFSNDPDFEKIKNIRFSPTDDIVGETAAAKSELTSLTADLQRVSAEKDTLTAWGDFDINAIRELEDKGFKTRWYKVSKKAFKQEWEEQYPLAVINRNDSDVWFVTVSDDPEYALAANEIQAPSNTCFDKEDELKDLHSRIISAKGKLNTLKEFVPNLKEEYEKELITLDKYLAQSASTKAADNKIVSFVGFTPEENDEALEKELAQMDVYYIKEAAVTEDEPPIKLKNNWFVRMFEPITQMYGVPVYNEFDPTTFVSIFFMLFFAFCMGDMGYGLLLIIGGFFLKKVDSFKNYSPLVVTLGVATTVIGFLFHTFFSMDIMTWKCIPDACKSIMLPSKIMGYDGTMVLSIIVGIFHLSVAFVVKAIYATKKNGFLNSLGTWGWTLLIVGGVIVGGISLTGVLNAALTKWIIIILGIVSASGIFILNDIHRNPLINIGSGLWDTYNTATGLLGDVLSYLRLYALGLAGSMLGSAFNSIGLMILGDGSFINWIPFILLILVGHTLNIAMAALGAFVHPLRLNFLEFFKNSGYEGTGRNFNPLSKTINN